MAGIALLGYLLVIDRGSGITVIPLLGFALEPSAYFHHSKSTAVGIIKRFSFCNIKCSSNAKQQIPDDIGRHVPIEFEKSIKLDSSLLDIIREIDVLSDLSVEIIRGERVGLIGAM